MAAPRRQFTAFTSGVNPTPQSLTAFLFHAQPIKSAFLDWNALER